MIPRASVLTCLSPPRGDAEMRHLKKHTPDTGTAAVHADHPFWTVPTRYRHMFVVLATTLLTILLLKSLSARQLYITELW